jgi:outer membrane protein OmpA-like peptidoglycan-associated protein
MGVTAPHDRKPKMLRLGPGAPPASDAPATTPAAFYNPFASPSAYRSASPAASRTLANGATLAAVPPAGQDRIDALARPAPQPSREPALAMTVMAGGPASPPPAPKAAPADASAGSKPSGSSGSSSGGGSGAGSGDGGGNGRGGSGRDRLMNQDDIAGVILAIIALLLLLLLVWPRGGPPAGEDGLVQTQLAAVPAPPPEPEPDPFGHGPVDLRPTSPPPETPVAPAAAPAPAPAAELPVAACPISRQVRALFCTDTDQLTLAARDALDTEIADWRSCIRDREIVVTGYADTRGPKEYNVDLAARRARSIASILRAEGLSVAETIGFGEVPDIEDNTNCSNQRRVDIGLKEAGVTPPSLDCTPPEDLRRLVCD